MSRSGKKLHPEASSGDQGETKRENTGGSFFKYPGQPSFSGFSKSLVTSKTSLDVKLGRIADTLEQKEEKESWESFRLKTKEFLTHSVIGEIYSNLLLAASVFSCFQYLSNTYREDETDKDYVELGIAIVFTLDWCLNCFIADHKVLFFTR